MKYPIEILNSKPTKNEKASWRFDWRNQKNKHEIDLTIDMKVLISKKLLEEWGLSNSDAKQSDGSLNRMFQSVLAQCFKNNERYLYGLKVNSMKSTEDGKQP
jgi:hypothetical protein|tara:strand:- start:1957 stop:2262 length:306 start_codon:yes stop_codon:yes gene_type:complete